MLTELNAGIGLSNSSTGSAPDGFASLLILPASFTKFNINQSGNNIQLSWSVDKETTNRHYEIERSIDGLRWKKIAEVSSASYSIRTKSFSYTGQYISGPMVIAFSR
jgi:hypothetical protein